VLLEERGLALVLGGEGWHLWSSHQGSRTVDRFDRRPGRWTFVQHPPASSTAASPPPGESVSSADSAEVARCYREGSAPHGALTSQGEAKAVRSGMIDGMNQNTQQDSDALEPVSSAWGVGRDGRTIAVSFDRVEGEVLEAHLSTGRRPVIAPPRTPRRPRSRWRRWFDRNMRRGT
jgi:hypothetical protein